MDSIWKEENETIGDDGPILGGGGMVSCIWGKTKMKPWPWNEEESASRCIRSK
jgi:hypothetical protein